MWKRQVDSRRRTPPRLPLCETSWNERGRCTRKSMTITWRLDSLTLRRWRDFGRACAAGLSSLRSEPERIAGAARAHKSEGITRATRLGGLPPRTSSALIAFGASLIAFLTGGTDAIIQLAPGVSCNARFTTPCARTNSQWLAETTRLLLEEAQYKSYGMQAVLESITNKELNRRSGFYPFVFSRETGKCVAHGAHEEFVGMTIEEIFDLVHISYADPHALHDRFIATHRGWVSYLWSDDGREVRGKLAYVVNNITDGSSGHSYYLGVGFENEPLPFDLPCSDKFDRWCSLTNVRSLVGRAQFELARAASLEDFENTMYRMSFSENEYKVPGGFYLFMYNFDGKMTAHGALRDDSFGQTLSEIFVDKKLGSVEEGQALHETFRDAVSGDYTVAWVQYPWRDSLDAETYTKVAFLIRANFGNEEYYVGAGFRFVVDEIWAAPLGKVCSDQYNLPCSFRIAHQLSSHTLAHAVSSMPRDEVFSAVSRDPAFKHGDFYVFIYSFAGYCMAHGGDDSFVGMTLEGVFELMDIPMSGERLHTLFKNAATQGGGWVKYDWASLVDPEKQHFQKITYIFQITIDDEDYYGGIGFSDRRYPLEEFSEVGLKQNGDPIPCSKMFGHTCSEINARAILGQALADLTLSSSEASAADTFGPKTPIEKIFSNISSRDPDYSLNDFSVGVFSFDSNQVCATNDGSGCAVAFGSNSEYVGLTWNEILDLEDALTIQGTLLHKNLIDASNSGTGVFTYPYSGTNKRAWVARFKHNNENYYVVSEYMTAASSPTCLTINGTNGCPSDMACTEEDQAFCQPITKAWVSVAKHPAFIAVLLLLLFSVPIAVYFVRRQKIRGREKLQRAVQKLEEQMQGIYEVVEDMHIRSASEYKEKVGKDADDKCRRMLKATWYWREDESRIDQHRDEMKAGPGSNYVAYSQEISNQIEHAFMLYKGQQGFKEFRVDLTDKITSTKTGKKLTDSGYFYQINFENMCQANSRTKFRRDIIRTERAKTDDPSHTSNLPLLPDDIDFTSDNKETLLPTYKGQLIQVSKIHRDEKGKPDWMYGNVLYDPLLEAATDQQDGDKSLELGSLNALFADALHDRPTSGWFPHSVTKTANAKQMHKLLKTLGGNGSDALAIPDGWAESKDERVELSKETDKIEYDEVVDYFMAALYGQREKYEVKRVCRIQNVPLWQSYSVKKQTMMSKYGEGGNSKRIHNKDLDLEMLERRWLFHGTRAEVMPKIEKQGFNRSFAGHNNVVYGRGVYFARDTSYSSHHRYSVPDETTGLQHMFMCRVAVGDWSRGSHGQVTPEPKPYNQFELFDTTVDHLDNPSIFVVYHDAQAYPEYLISFRKVGSRARK